jgi:4-alpha-glucanotransferase
MTQSDLSANFPPFSPDGRSSGVLLHVTSLPSPYGIGDVGPAAYEWVDRLHMGGQSWWQALPLGPTGYGNSPYQCLSSFAGNGLLASPDLLIEEGLLGPDDCDAGRSFSEGAVDFNAVTEFKHRLLEKAWANFSAAQIPALRSDFDRFCFEQAHWLDDYAFFRALKAHYGGASYLNWPAELVRRKPFSLARVRRYLAERIDQSRFAQLAVLPSSFYSGRESG